jgi:uncharacterized protein (DUF2267 family)
VCRLLAPELDTRRIVERQLQHVMRARLKKSLSAANIASEAMELQQLLRDGPRKLSDIMALLAENRLQMKVTGLEESRLMENLQKIANRVASHHQRSIDHGRRDDDEDRHGLAPVRLSPHRAGAADDRRGAGPGHRDQCIAV